MKTKVQKSKLGTTTGSLFNYLMGNNQSLPIVGEGATVLHWSDRDAYEVLAVSEDSECVVIAQYRPKRIDNEGISESQDYEYIDYSDHLEVVVWRNGSWKTVIHEIDFVKSFWEEYQSQPAETVKQWREDNIEPLYDEDYHLKLVPGKTRLKTKYDKINIIFGVKKQYYDYSF